MQIIIPMSGKGQRFIDRGYSDPKPLIKVDGRPIIEHVCNLFPGEANFTFICNQEHLDTTNMRDVLLSIKPDAKIISIDPHKKGPVYAVSKIFDLIDDDDEVIVSYCDYGTYWDYQDFLTDIHIRNADGAVISYKNFHPHMLGSTNYAFMRDDGDRWMLEIKEKEPFTSDRMQEYASNGTYYFKHGKYVKKYFNELMNQDINLNGEYYVSLVYNLLVAENLKVSIYEIEHMLQWGTPDDVDEYNKWSSYFTKLSKNIKILDQFSDFIKLIPLAGAGSRFVKENYQDPKPLIPVLGEPMIINAATSLPDGDSEVFICQQEHLRSYPLEPAIKIGYPNAEIISIDGLTEGQASTCMLGLDKVDLTKKLMIGACDNAMLYDEASLRQLIEDPEIDAIIFSFRDHISVKRNPEMYGYIDVDADNSAKSVSVKVPLSKSPEKDHAIVGSFYFREAKIFKLGYAELVRNNNRVNGEFYVDSLMQELITLGYKVKIFEVTDYICFGTPNDLRIFEYWQSFFTKCSWHEYS
jgi:NDP-sugar pyrophosphorylase family protein